jgi:hypothetical protein
MRKKIRITSKNKKTLEKYSNIKLREKRGCKRKHLYGDERRAVSEKKSEEEKNLKRIKSSKDENNSEAYYNPYRNQKNNEG